MKNTQLFFWSKILKSCTEKKKKINEKEKRQFWLRWSKRLLCYFGKGKLLFCVSLVVVRLFALKHLHTQNNIELDTPQLSLPPSLPQLYGASPQGRRIVFFFCFENLVVSV